MEYESQKIRTGTSGYCTVEDGIIYEINPLYTGQKQRVGVTDNVYNELKSISEEYYNKLVELGAIVPPKTPEQIQAETMQMMSSMLAEMKSMININRSGIYRIEFAGYGASNTDNGTIGVQLVVDKKEVPQAEATVETDSAIQPEQIAFTALVPIKICPCGGSKTVTVLATGTAGTLSLANLTVTKIR